MYLLMMLSILNRLQKSIKKFVVISKVFFFQNFVLWKYSQKSSSVIFFDCDLHTIMFHMNNFNCTNKFKNKICDVFFVALQATCSCGKRHYAHINYIKRIDF